MQEEKMKKILYTLGNLTESVKIDLEEAQNNDLFSWETKSALQKAEELLSNEIGKSWLATDWGV